MGQGVATFLQTAYQDTNQTGTVYPLAIDGDIQLFSRSANMFSCHQRQTANMTVEVDPGFIYDPVAQTLAQVGNYVHGSTHTNTTVDALDDLLGATNGFAIRGDGIPANATISSGAGTASLGISNAATATATGVYLTFSQISATIVAPVSNPRIDLVVVDAGTGIMSIVTGTPAATPAPPALPAGKLPIAQILLQTSTTTITNSLITDRRAVWMGKGGNIPWTTAGGTGDAITGAYTPAIPALYDGLILAVRAGAANTLTNPTFQPDANTLHTITQLGGQPLAAGSIFGAGHELLLRYKSSGTLWELLNPAPASGVPPGTVADYAGAFSTPAGWVICGGQAISRTTFSALFAAICQSTTGNFSSGSAIVTAIPNTANWVAGMPISGPNVPAAATVLSVDSSSQIHMSANAVGTLPATGAAIVVGPNGIGDGSTTFNVPDYRGRVGVGVDNMNGSAANRITTGQSGIAGTRLGASGGNETVALIASQQATMPVTGGTVSSASLSGGTTSVSCVTQTTTAAPGNTGAQQLSITICTPGIVYLPGSASGSVSGTISGQTVAAQTATGGGGPHQNTQPTIMANKIIKT